MITELDKNTNLFDHATSESTLRAAWEKVYGNRGAAGGDGVSVDKFARTVGKRLTVLRKNLRDGWHRPVDLRRVPSTSLRTFSDHLFIAEIATPHFLSPAFA